MSYNPPETACYGKQAFPSFEKGKRAIDRIRKFDKGSEPIALYRCPYCPDWHIGTKIKGRRSK